MPLTRSKYDSRKASKKVEKIELNFDSELEFIDKDVQLVWTGIYYHKIFTLKSFIQIGKIFLTSKLVPNNNFLIQADDQLKAFLNIQCNYLFKSEWIHHIHNIIKTVNGSGQCTFKFPPQVIEYANIALMPVKKVITVDNNIPVSLSQNLSAFLKDTLGQEQEIWTLGAIKNQIRGFLNAHRDNLCEPHEKDILLVSRYPSLLSLYNCHAIHSSQQDLFLFHVCYFSNCYELQVIEP